MSMPRKSSPSATALRLVEDMRAFFAEESTIKADQIAERQLQLLREYAGPQKQKLRLIDVKEMFLRMRDNRSASPKRPGSSPI
jgi:hypothetical protein